MKFFATTFFVLSTLLVYSQGEDNSLEGVPFKERIVTGGGFGFGFTDTQEFISVSPVIGYQITKKLMAGTGVTYRYSKLKYAGQSIKLNDYGVNPFARFVVYQNIFLQTEFEHLNYEYPLSFSESTRRTFDSFLAGGGFVQPLSDKVGFYLMALYNFSYSEQYAYVYDSPLVIRAGINVGNFSF